MRNVFKLKEQALKRVEIVSFIILLILMVVFSCLKSGFHMDELYSFSFANGKGFLYEDIKEATDENGTYNYMSKDDVKDALTVTGKEDAFQFGKIAKNCAKDVHPPLYYWLLNSISSVFSIGTLSKWPGLILNMFFYIITLFLLYKTVDKLFEKPSIAFCVTLLYGASPIGLSSMLMIRMYCLLTLFSVLFIYLTVLYEKRDKLCIRVFILLATTLGMLTQYFFIIFIAITGITYCIYQIIRKSYKKAVLYLVSILSGVLLMLLIFPQSIQAILSDKKLSGASTLSALLDIQGWFKSITGYFTIKQFLGSIIVIVLIGVFLVVLLIVKRVKTGEKFQMDDNAKFGFILVIAGIVTLIAIMILSPYAAARYTCTAFPLLYLLAGVLLYCCKDISDLKIRIGALVLSLLCVIAIRPGYLYTEDMDYHRSINENGSKYCMYLGTFKFYHESIMICDAADYMAFDETLLAERVDSKGFYAIMNKLKDVKQLTVFIGIDPDIRQKGSMASPFYGEHEAEIIMKNLNMTKYKCIRSGDYSKTYLIER